MEDKDLSRREEGRNDFMSRTKNSALNAAVSVVTHAISLVTGFISRSVFVRTLSAEYLGINGLFFNILSMLSLAELGIGAAIAYSLYRPIALGDTRSVRILMAFYRRAYLWIGAVVFLLGAAMTPFLNHLFKSVPDIPHLRLYFFLFLLNSTVSYLYAYKRSLIIAHQKEYIATAYYQFFYVLRQVAQIVLLLTTGRFLFYLLAQLVCTLLENVLLSRRADRMYPYLKEPCGERLDAETFGTIRKNTAAMLFHKIGGVMVFGTDSILIAKLAGVVQVGLYSNYCMIIDALATIFGRLFWATTASVGNVGATERTERARSIFGAVDLAAFWVYGSVSLCLLVLVNPFITLWLGPKYLFPMGVVLPLALNFYLTGMRQSVHVFKNALGLFWQDRYKPLFEAAINLAASIALFRVFGVAGVVLGTTVSTVTVCVWVEPYVLYRFGFGHSVREYFARYATYGALLLAAGTAVRFVDGLIVGQGLGILLLRALACVAVTNALFFAALFRRKEFRFLLEHGRMLFHKG